MRAQTPVFGNPKIKIDQDTLVRNSPQLTDVEVFIGDFLFAGIFAGIAVRSHSRHRSWNPQGRYLVVEGLVNT
jgi:hypothetical protein